MDSLFLKGAGGIFHRRVRRARRGKKGDKIQLTTDKHRWCHPEPFVKLRTGSVEGLQQIPLAPFKKERGFGFLCGLCVLCGGIICG
jgi:hypothetical protein